MKKNLFEIKSEEIQRILSLHESRTKSQYLNIMEQSSAAKGTYENPFNDEDLIPDVDKLISEIDGWVDSENLNYVLAIVTKYVNKYAIDPTDVTTTKIIPALYRIRVLYFEDEGEKLIDDINSIGTMTLSGTKKSSAETMKKQILNILKVASSGQTIQTKPSTPKVAKTQFDIQYNHSFGNGAFKIPAKSVAKKYNNDYVLITTPDKKKIWFYCDTKTYSNGGAYVPEDKNATGLSTNLLSATYLCNKPQASGPPPLDATSPPATDTLTPPVVDSTQKVKTQQVNRQKQFTQNTVAAINNVQKALGVPEPNGQLKNSDIDNIISKLQ